MSTNLTTEILTHLIEECSEVIQEACKIKRFGLDSYHPAEPDMPNIERLKEEIGDLQAMIDIARFEIFKQSDPNAEDVNKKIIKKYDAIHRNID